MLSKDVPAQLNDLLLSVAITFAALAFSLTLPVGAELKSGHRPASSQIERFEDSAPRSRPVDMATALPSYIASRWSLDERRARRLVELTTAAADRHTVDPLLALAVIAKESAFRYTGNPGDFSVKPAAVNPLEPHGLMQVAGRWHPEKMPVDSHGNIRVTTTKENIVAGVQVLAEYLQREGGDVMRALQLYNGNLADAQARYAHQVLRLREQLRKAVAHSA